MMLPLRIRRKIKLDPLEKCWIWVGGTNANGYGRIQIGGRVENGGKKWLVHRFVYVLFKGEIKPAHDIDHTCANRYCCNPRHLREVTHAENMKEMFHRKASKKTAKVQLSHITH